MIAYGIMGSQKRTGICDDPRSPICKVRCTCKNRKRKGGNKPLSVSKKNAYQSMKGSTRAAIKNENRTLIAEYYS